MLFLAIIVCVDVSLLPMMECVHSPDQEEPQRNTVLDFDWLVTVVAHSLQKLS
jgi:hypothetical protein